MNTRYYNRIWDASQGKMLQVAAGQRFEINIDGSGVLVANDGVVICLFGPGHLLPCTGVQDSQGVAVYDGDFVAEPGSSILYRVSWHQGGYYLVSLDGDSEIDSIRVDAAERMNIRGNIFEGLI